MNKSKGQYLTIEQVLVFTMGVFLLISVAIIYNLAQVNAKKISVEDQFREVADLTLSNIIYVYNAGKNNDLDTEVFFSIPLELSSQGYRINLTQQNIFIQSYDDPTANYTLPVGNINESVTLSGQALSPKGRAKINYNLTANSIVLRDV